MRHLLTYLCITNTKLLCLLSIEEKNPRNHFGGTPFHSAAAKGHTLICQLFIEKVMPIDSSGETPLHLAANNGHLGIQFNIHTFWLTYIAYGTSCSVIFSQNVYYKS